VSQSYSDQVFSFAGPASDACRKIVRTWTIMDACSPEVLGQNPIIYQQAIKVNNNTAPTISGCAPLQVNTVDCNSTNVSFSVTALDDCAPTTNVNGSINFYLYSGGTLSNTISSVGNIIYFDQSLPVGTHSAVISFSDLCGNTESCTKTITVTNTTTPTVTCKGISVNIQAMDLDNDPSTPAINMAMINPQALIESTYNPCGYSLNYSFSQHPNSGDVERIFSCTDKNSVQAVTVYAYDFNGIGSSCTSNVTVQDNNNLCPVANQVVMSGCENTVFQVVSCPSVGPQVDFNVLGTSANCPGTGDLIYTVRIDYDSNNTIDILTTSTSSTGYDYSYITAPGTHTINVIGMDACGVSAVCNKSFVVGCDVILPSSGGGSDGITGCEDETFILNDCTPGSGLLSFDIGFSNSNCGIFGDYIVVAKVDYYSDGTNDLREDILVSNAYSYNFATVPGEHTLDITFTDPCGTVENCAKVFTVECVTGVGGDGSAIVRGAVFTEENVAVEDVMVEMEGSQLDEEMTNVEGSYEFPAMDIGGQYRISPSKVTRPLNGVSTLDLIHIQRHILGIERLDSPYKIIAADIDKSGNVNGVDLVELRKLILGINEDFPRNTSWRMIDKGQTFFDPLNPFASSIDEDYIISNLSADMEVDFIGVKIGDVDNSVELNASSKLSTRSLDNYGLVIPERKYVQGTTEEIVFSLPATTSLLGLQAALSFDSDRIELIELVPISDDLHLSNFNLNSLSAGKVAISWDSEKSIESSESLEEEIVLYQNRPNPWSETTEISYYLPAAKDIILSVYDINGKLIYQEQKIGEKGLNIVSFSRADLDMSGVLYYELVADNYRAIEKMILID